MIEINIFFYIFLLITSVFGCYVWIIAYPGLIRGIKDPWFRHAHDLEIAEENFEEWKKQELEKFARKIWKPNDATTANSISFKIVEWKVGDYE